MTRSNGPATQPGAWPHHQQQPSAHPHGQHSYPQQQPVYEQDHGQNHGWNTAHQGGGFPHSPPQGGHPHQQHPHHAAGQPQAGYAPSEPRTQPPGYHYPPASDPHDSYAPAGFGASETTGRPFAQGAAYGGTAYGAAYAPQFDPYTPPAGAPAFGTQQQGYAPQPAYQPPPAFTGPASSPSQELSSLQRPSQHPAASPELRGPHFDPPFEQWGQGYGAAQPAADPHGYDLGGYAPAAPEIGMSPHPSLDAGRGAPAHLGGGFGGHGAGAGHGAGHPGGQPDWGVAEHHYDPYAPQMGYQQAPHPEQPGSLDAGVPHGNQLEPAFQDEAHDDLGEYEYDEPPRGRRWGLIAASLFGAIAIGAGLSYGYKLVLGPDSTAATPVVKNSGSPAKVKPAEPGGKQFAHTDSKIMGRLNDQQAGSDATASDADSGGARKVQTMVIGRDGSIMPPAPGADPRPTRTAAASSQQVNVPGMTIVDGFGGRPPTAVMADGAPPPPGPSLAASMPAAAPPPQPARPVIVTPPAAKQPTVLARAAPVTAPEADPTPAAPKAAAPKAAVPKKTAAAAPAASAPTGGNGFVAVLASVPASQKSSLDALKQFADMQQKYGTALANKTPEVREANLGDKGTYHRLLVGPPGSREQAGQLCSQLKAQGYGSCWVTAY